ncbi:hypothetical protein [Streptomyces sp. NPDC093707]|uniref:hypothetical protein n=1 Tax=Streptomyces sp. NPDC093707 TaxID=3154984 RepID=UPI00344FEE77
MPYVFQQYDRHSHGRDLRVVVVDGCAVTAQPRVADGSRLASNLASGSAELIGDVLVWQLHHLGYVTPLASAPRPQCPRSSPAAAPAAAAVVRQGSPRPRRR